ncbi:hypothetical protein NQ315_003889 [Exocentrus adspersus]|uniref:Uncharacterized protein n=1 Tax=Exocentrus adspersus TaxID=1586481 RepID=A0AAV8VYU6_9CUCU|nr:hypothetical protein NQ315_003889 [Exocentrus adspersus]
MWVAAAIDPTVLTLGCWAYIFSFIIQHMNKHTGIYNMGLLRNVYHIEWLAWPQLSPTSSPENENWHFSQFVARRWKGLWHTLSHVPFKYIHHLETTNYFLVMCYRLKTLVQYSKWVVM